MKNGFFHRRTLSLVRGKSNRRHKELEASRSKGQEGRKNKMESVGTWRRRVCSCRGTVQLQKKERNKAKQRKKKGRGVRKRSETTKRELTLENTAYATPRRSSPFISSNAHRRLLIPYPVYPPPLRLRYCGDVRLRPLGGHPTPLDFQLTVDRSDLPVRAQH